MEFAPYTVDVPEEALDDLRARLERTRLPNQIEGIGWEQGTERSFLVELLDHWRTAYDWRAQEARLNAFPHLTTEVDGQRLHLIHARSPHEGALPLLLTHGWPGSVVEFLDVLEPLTNPPDPADAFHVVAPSLPGFAFSGETTKTGWQPRRIAEAFVEIVGALGYERFGAQGGDWGSFVSGNVADLAPDRVVGLHLNYVAVGKPADAAPLTEQEQREREALDARWRTGAGYQEQQGTKPQTLGYGLQDSPAGLAAWIIEKFETWSEGDLRSVYSLDHLLTNVMVYWVTGTAASSCRIYWEMRQAGGKALPQAPVTVPTGIARYPGEVTKFPRAWIERRYNVTYWSEPARGGHFAAMEAPTEFVDDVRAFFRTVR